MPGSDPVGKRPVLVTVFAFLLVASSLFMAMLGWSASAYYVPALCLFMQAFLLWRARGYGWFKWTLVINQISGLALILVLWLGSGLGAAKLDISGAMLLLNLLCGGPLMAILAIPTLPALHAGRSLHRWFHPSARQA